MIARLGTEPFDLDTRDEGEHVVVTATGELDVYTAERFRVRLIEQSNAGRHTLVIDMAAVPFVDSSGLGVLVGAYKRARAHGGAVCLLSPSAHLRRLLAITGLAKVIPAFADVDEAIGHLDARRR